MSKRQPLLKPGDVHEGYRVIDDAPLDHIRGSRTRAISGHMISGAWSDPLWLFDPARGWAVARTWRSKETKVFDGGRDDRGHLQLVPFPAREEIVVTPWPPEGEANEQ